jgi:hypothetical protein
MLLHEQPNVEAARSALGRCGGSSRQHRVRNFSSEMSGLRQLGGGGEEQAPGVHPVGAAVACAHGSGDVVDAGAQKKNGGWRQEEGVSGAAAGFKLEGKR